MSATSMKGLTQFIVDIRNSQDHEEEKKRINQEINNIHTKFSSSHLNSYLKKKYICKLMYIYLLGYDNLVEFGVKEGLKLAGSRPIQEKSLGYLALSILLSNTSTAAAYFNLVFNLVNVQLTSDLRIDNENHNALALHFIANNFNLPGYIVEENDDNAAGVMELANQVYSLAISPMSSLLLKKKSLVCLKMLIKLCPSLLIVNDNWIPRLLSLMDFNNNLSVVLNALPVAEIIIGLKPAVTKNVVSSIAYDLNELVIKNNCDDAYTYHKIPAPWLTIKLFQLLETCFLSDMSLVDTLNPNDAKVLKMVISAAINQATKSINGMSNKNIQSSMLFQSVSLAIFLNASNDSIVGAINALLHLLQSNDTNTRYLSLDVLIKLIGRSTDEKMTKSYNKIIFQNIGAVENLLNDKDISIKRKSLDLLYIITNDTNYQIIINKFIDFFPILDFQLKSELSIKVAVLAEKFARDSTWYVNIMIRLLSIPSTSANSDYLNNEIWERIIQIIVNNQDLHTKTCKMLMTKLSKNRDQQLSGNLVKISAFLIGEYGHLIKTEVPPDLQFQVLYDVYLKATLVTRSMILSTFLKFCYYYPNEDFIPNIIDLFEAEKDSMDLEIQTRANEYLNLFTIDNTNVLESVVKPLPPFETDENHLAARLGSINKIVGSKSKSFVHATKIQKKPILNSSVSDNIIDIDEADETQESINPFEDKLVLSPNWYNGYHRMLHYDAGIFYESQLVKITYKLDRVDNFKLRYRFQVINTSYRATQNNLTSFKILELKSFANSVNPSYIVDITESPQQVITDKSLIEIEVKVRHVVEPNESPVLGISFNCGGSFNQLNLKFPVNTLKTITPTTLLLDEFKSRWLQINQLLPNNLGEYVLHPQTPHQYSGSTITRLLQRLKFSVVFSSGDEDPSKVLILGAGILHTQTSNYGVLLSVKSVANDSKHFEITVKCTGEGVSKIIALALAEIFQTKF